MSVSLGKTSVKVNSKISKKDGRPYGLASLCDNWLKGCKQAEALKYGFVSEDDIVKSFQDMLKRVDGKRSCLFVNAAGEVKTFPVRSRWNSEFNYGGMVSRKALDEVKGLRRVSHLVLTIDVSVRENHIPAWWVYGDEEFYAVMGGRMISEFLRKFRVYKKKKQEPNNFITWVMELHEKSNFVHFHLLFYGGWIAPIDELQKMWPWSADNGVRLGKPIKHSYAGDTLARYLSRYITKDLQFRDDVKLNKKLTRVKAFLWFFKRRLYNLRHKVRNSDGVYTLGIGREHFVNPEKWKVYVSASGKDADVHYIEGVKMTGNRKRDLKLVAEMPVKYPVPVF